MFGKIKLWKSRQQQQTRQPKQTTISSQPSVTDDKTSSEHLQSCLYKACKIGIKADKITEQVKNAFDDQLTEEQQEMIVDTAQDTVGTLVPGFSYSVEQGVRNIEPVVYPSIDFKTYIDEQTHFSPPTTMYNIPLSTNHCSPEWLYFHSLTKSMYRRSKVPLDRVVDIANWNGKVFLCVFVKI